MLLRSERQNNIFSAMFQSYTLCRRYVYHTVHVLLSFWCHIFPNVLFLMLLLAWHKLFIKHSFTCEKSFFGKKGKNSTMNVYVSFTPGTSPKLHSYWIRFFPLSYLLWIQHSCWIKVNAFRVTWGGEKRETRSILKI